MRLFRSTEGTISLANLGFFAILVSLSASSLLIGRCQCKPLETPALVELNVEQCNVLKAASVGHSLFFTGGAGTGKSLLLRTIIESLRTKYAKVSDAVAVTAPTGMAASNIGGMTIHSFFGAGLALELAEILADKIRHNSKALNRWRRVRVLVIDEVSMLEASLFDKLASVAGILRKSQEPFGGIQIIVTGDFFQLPPVAKSSKVRFAFEAAAWTSVITRAYRLTTIYRQQDRSEFAAHEIGGAHVIDFAAMLNEVRFGRLSQRTIALFHSLARPLNDTNGLGPTELFPRRYDVESANISRLDQLNTPVCNFESVDGGSVTDEGQRERLLAAVMAPKRLRLRIGAQVMLVKNTSQDLVNGSVGCVVGFATVRQGKEVPKTEAAQPASVGSGIQTESDPLYPLVLFRFCDGRTIETLIEPQVFKIEASSGDVRVSRTQIPLILAWSISIHKAQGQTLDLVKVDLKKVFEKGQVYVALSRARSLAGLQIRNFNPSLVKAHPRVIEWNSAFEVFKEE